MENEEKANTIHPPPFLCFSHLQSIPTIILHHKEYTSLETEPFQEFFHVETLLKDYGATPMLASRKFFSNRHISPHTSSSILTSIDSNSETILFKVLRWSEIFVPSSLRKLWNCSFSNNRFEMPFAWWQILHIRKNILCQAQTNCTCSSQI